MATQALKIGIGAHVNGYDVLVLPDRIVVHRGSETKSHPVPNYGTDVAELAGRPGARIAWGRFPDGDEVIFVYDSNDANFGYALNLDCGWCSEWGYAPFPSPARRSLPGGSDDPPR
ncbi:MAG: hypothetical protein ACRDJC_21490 [Thermomicrobiales bacterium]